eukprot:c35044_g1_i1.p1 GENE.c35044_g1_i1~~c35044_g1_i1.p1  ORF type:complete len:251 (+),score=84.05 c35044_g1_i1:23-754(+)
MLLSWGLEFVSACSTIAYIQYTSQSRKRLGVYDLYSHILRIIPMLCYLTIVIGIWHRCSKAKDQTGANRAFYTMLGVFCSLCGDAVISINTNISALFGSLGFIFGQACFVFSANQTPGIQFNLGIAITCISFAPLGQLILAKHLKTGTGVLTFCYILMVLMVIWRSISRLLAEGPGLGAWRAILGGLLRIISDSFLLVSLFTKIYLEYSNYSIIAYYTAIYLTVSSVQRGGILTAEPIEKKKK